VLVSIVDKKVTDLLNVRNQRKLVVETQQVEAVVSIVAKMAINHLNVQNRKKADHHLVVEAVAVEVVVELVVVVLNEVSVVVTITVIVLVKQLAKRSNSTMTTSD
jgi:hypothetical protein